MSRRNYERFGVLLAGTILLLVATGCPFTTTAPEAVLEGTWQLTGDVISPDVTNFLISFDSSGKITGINYQYKGGTVTISPSLINSSSTVSGTSVSISATWYLGGTNSLSFIGELNSTNTVINGSTEYGLWVGGINLSIPTGPATLTKR